MDFDTLVQKFQALEQRVEKLENPVPATPTPPTPAKVYEFDAAGFLVGGTSLAGYRIDPIVGPDCPRTVTPTETNHTLSIARPDLDEKFIGYCTRVSAQARGNPQTVGALFGNTEHLFDRWGGYKADGSNWPFAADRFFNGAAYGDAGGAPPVVAVPGAPPVVIFEPLPTGEEPL